MQWLIKIADEIMAAKPDGEIIVSSGVSPSGTYHLGTLREVLTAEAITRELKRRGRPSRHLHIVDDLDVFRKVPAGLPESFSQYLGQPLCDVPSPVDKQKSYADYFFEDFLQAAQKLGLEMEVIRSHQKYRDGFFVPAIEKSLNQVGEIRQILETISGRKLDEQWSPVQVIEDGYLKNRAFKSIDSQSKAITYIDNNGKERTVSYSSGDVKLNWRIDWPARWWLLNVGVEPFGRDHATKGGSYDTGAVIAEKVFGARPPLPVPYNFINRTGETKKMSKSAGDVVTAGELIKILPAEIIWYFILRYSPDKQLFFDEGDGLMRLVDEFAELLAKPAKTSDEQLLIDFCLQGQAEPTVSNIPFSHLVASYQASLKDPAKTLDVIKRTEHAATATEQNKIIINELNYIDEWLAKWAPEEVKFELKDKINPEEFSETEQQFLKTLGAKISQAPADAGGEWFHKAIYDLRDSSELDPSQMFECLYRLLIGKKSGPRAGWFLSILPRDWLVKRLNFEA